MSNVYDYGGPVDYLADIHFPKRRAQIPPEIVAPWFWFLRVQLPTYFSYLGGVWGHGWVCEPHLPVIKILPIDSQRIVPTKNVGFGSIEEAIDRTNGGQPISQDAWGRFHFGGPSQSKPFFKVIGKKVPEYSVKKGVPTQVTDAITGLPKGRRLADVFREAVMAWRDDWNTGANLFNAAANHVDGDGSYSIIAPFNGFSTPGPYPGEPILSIVENLIAGKEYFGAPPATYTFRTGNAMIFKQSFAFTMEVGQMDPFEWDFTRFPPRRTSLLQKDGGSGNPPFAATLNAGAYNPSPFIPPFPQSSPIIVGASAGF